MGGYAVTGSRASGGHFGPGAYLVGENGPEIATFGTSGYMVNATRTAGCGRIWWRLDPVPRPPHHRSARRTRDGSPSRKPAPTPATDEDRLMAFSHSNSRHGQLVINSVSLMTPATRILNLQEIWSRSNRGASR